MPGTSGVMSVCSDVNSMYFDDHDEPDAFLFQLTKDLEQYYHDHPTNGVDYVVVDFENKDAYYNAIMAMQKFTKDNIKVSGTSRENHYQLVIEEEENNDEFST